MNVLVRVKYSVCVEGGGIYSVCVCVVRNVAAGAFSLRCGSISVFSLSIPAIPSEIRLTIGRLTDYIFQ